jgi:hypothetical protein
MARALPAKKLKVFKTHIGFHDLLVAAPSMKAAAEAWGSDAKIFAQGFAARTGDAGEVEAALAEPGTVLKRPHGQKGAWRAEPQAVQAPKAGKRRKDEARKAAAAHKRKAAAEKKARAAAEKKAKKDARDELAEIERQEAELRAKRQRLQKKFHLRAVK